MPSARVVGLVAVSILFLAAPVAISEFELFQLSLVVIYAVGLLGLVVLSGKAGLLSFGQGAFFTIGAYTTAIVLDRVDVPYLVAVGVGGIFAFGVGALIGFGAVRLSAIGLGMVTIGMAVAVAPLIKRFPDLTNGFAGIGIKEVQPPGFIPLDQPTFIFYLFVVILGAMMLLAWRVTTGRAGRALLATRDHEVAATAMGIAPLRWRTFAFALSGFFGGIAGGLYLLAFQFIGPETFTLFTSFALVVAVVIGGIESLPGVLVGGAFIVYTRDLIDTQGLSDVVSADIVYGTALILLVLLVPRGRRLWAVLRRTNGPKRAVNEPDREPGKAPGFAGEDEFTNAKVVSHLEER